MAIPDGAEISIHAPREGGDSTTELTLLYMLIFQSTPPARGATIRVHMVYTVGRHFNPRPPRGGRPAVFNYDYGFQDISIHAPREGGDRPFSFPLYMLQHFNPRPPRGGRPRSSAYADDLSGISIHAPREGGDIAAVLEACGEDISIHAPREGGDVKIQHGRLPPIFISIHAPREGGDIWM